MPPLALRKLPALRRLPLPSPRDLGMPGMEVTALSFADERHPPESTAGLRQPISGDPSQAPKSLQPTRPLPAAHALRPYSPCCRPSSAQGRGDQHAPLSTEAARTTRPGCGRLRKPGATLPQDHDRRRENSEAQADPGSPSGSRYNETPDSWPTRSSQVPKGGRGGNTRSRSQSRYILQALQAALMIIQTIARPRK